MRPLCDNERSHDGHGSCPGRGTRLNRCRCGAVAAITTPEGQVIGLSHDCTRTGPIREQVARDRALLDRIRR